MSIRITILSGKAFRGVTYFEATDLNASSALARYAVENGLAIYNFDLMTSDQLNDWYEEHVGYRPQVDEPRMTESELRDLIRSYAEAITKT